MATEPQFPVNGTLNITAALTAANTNMDGTGTVAVIGTAGTSGAYLYSVKGFQAGSNSAASLVARIFLNDGTGFTAGTSILIGELLLQASAISQTQPQRPATKHFNMRIPANYRILVAISAAQTAGWYFHPVMENL